MQVFCVGTSTMGVPAAGGRMQGIFALHRQAAQPSFPESASAGLFSGRPHSYLGVMRAVILITALFCALISGWTASLARVQDLGGLVTIHYTRASADHSASATSDREHCAPDSKNCVHPQTVHPLLCAACFAVVLDTPDLGRAEPASSTIRPLPQKPLQATAPEPQFPPPKPLLSAS